MMFSAGMGIGLMFYGVSEPVSHFVDPAARAPVRPATRRPSQTAMATTLFHWTLHPWAIYAVVGLAIAYGVFRKGRAPADQLRVRAAARASTRTARAAR